NGGGAVMTFGVALIFLFKFFSEGVWVLLILIPIMMVALMRMNRQYTEEEAELEEEAAELASRRILPKLVVLVMVDEMNRAAARALQYGRSLQPSEIRAVHLAVDAKRAKELAEEWTTLGLGRIPLQIVESPDRRVANGAMKVAASEARKGDREVTILLPQMEYRRFWHRILHDRTASAIAQAVDDLPRVNVTFVPYHLRAGQTENRESVADVIESHTTTQVAVGSIPEGRAPVATPPAADDEQAVDARLAVLADRPLPSSALAGSGIGAARFRDRVELDGRVQSMRVQPWSGVATLEITLTDDTGSIAVVFLGRRTIAGITPGTRLRVSGVVGSHHGRLAMLNPRYRIKG
ncbi:MAG TPA: OB-fold nucleic acid binding domain-containing protein, partial [Acidimicrobiales bacterium]|nr:OB-fold nucleic acid binding domain-containing protein [Acidimicrobiales bacterium]